MRGGKERWDRHLAPYQLLPYMDSVPKIEWGHTEGALGQVGGGIALRRDIRGGRDTGVRCVLCVRCLYTMVPLGVSFVVSGWLVDPGMLCLHCTHLLCTRVFIPLGGA